MHGCMNAHTLGQIAFVIRDASGKSELRLVLFPAVNVSSRLDRLFCQRHVVVLGRSYHWEDGGGVPKILVEGSEVRTSVFVVVQVAEVVRVAIVGVGDRVRIDGVVVTCSDRK